MDDLGFDFGNAVAWFPHEQEQPYVLVRMTAQHVALLEAAMAEPLRRCYITDEVLQAAASRHGLTLSDVLAGKLPDAGATMAGDFGEVLGYFYQSAMEYPGNAIGPKKWRLKQGATPQWYKQRQGIRTKALSGAARVARFRPPGAKAGR